MIIINYTSKKIYVTGSDEKLEWSKRYKIILGIAEGLRYLHESCERRIIHRDIKADNILLCEDYEPQVNFTPYSSLILNKKN